MGALLSKLKISHKLFLNSLAFILPIALLLYFTVAGIHDDILFSRKQRWGDRVQRPLNELLYLLPRHQLLARFVQEGNQTAVTELSTTAQQIESALTILHEAVERYGRVLQVDAVGLRETGMTALAPDALAQRWHSLKPLAAQKSGDHADLRYLELRTNIRRLISRVGDTSNLILDPDLDSYYLMDISLLAMPQAQERLWNILLLAKYQLAQQSLSSEQRVRFGVYAALLREIDLPRIQHGATTALREDTNFYGVSPSLLKNLPPVLARYEQASQNFQQMLAQLAQEAASGSVAFRDLWQAGDEMNAAALELWRVSGDELDRLLERRINVYQQRRFWYLFSSFSAVLIATLSVLVISRGIARRLANVVTVTRKVAEGDLTMTVTADASSDEIGQLLAAVRVMVDNLHGLISQMQQSGVKVSSSTTELAASSKEHEAIVSQQAKATQDVMLSVKQIANVTSDLVSTMHRVVLMSQETATFASGGQQSLQRMEDAMQRMETASQSISNRLEAINEKAANITSVVTTITKVADQTNLLSLNAAIEAEKAGEYGRGFTVVASEIRRLADQTAVATLDIDQMINEMQSAVLSGVKEMETFIVQVRHSAEDVEHISAKLTNIIEQVQALSPNFEQVNQAMTNQSQNAQQIDTAMMHLTEEMQQTRDSLQESFSAIDQLNDATRSLYDEIGKFKLKKKTASVSLA